MARYDAWVVHSKQPPRCRRSMPHASFPVVVAWCMNATPPVGSAVVQFAFLVRHTIPEAHAALIGCAHAPAPSFGHAFGCLLFYFVVGEEGGKLKDERGKKS